MRPYLRVQNVYENRIDISDINEMNFDAVEYETFRLKFGDLLLNEGQSTKLVGRPAIYRDELPGACFQNTLVRFRPYPQVNGEFALVVFRAYMHSGRFQKEAQQTTNIAHLSAGRFARMEFPLPPLPEQIRIVERVNELSQMCDHFELNLKKAALAAAALLSTAVRDLLATELQPCGTSPIPSVPKPHKTRSSAR